MRIEVIHYLNRRPELKEYVRRYPQWYRQLSRNPNSINELEYEAKIYFGKSFPQRVERLQHSIDLAMMLVQMLQVNGGIFSNEA